MAQGDTTFERLRRNRSGERVSVTRRAEAFALAPMDRDPGREEVRKASSSPIRIKNQATKFASVGHGGFHGDPEFLNVGISPGGRALKALGGLLFAGLSGAALTAAALTAPAAFIDPTGFSSLCTVVFGSFGLVSAAAALLFFKQAATGHV